MKVTYDPEVDLLRILFSREPIEESDEDKPGVILDYDKAGLESFAGKMTQRISALYGLRPEEIKIVEEASK